MLSASRRLQLLVVLALTFSAFGAGSAVAAPSLRATSSSASTSAGTKVVVPTPASVVAGDVLLAAVTVRLGPGGKITAPAGWVLVRKDVSSGGASLQQALYTHVAGSFEPASSTWVLSGTVGWSATVLAFSGADNAAPVAASSGKVTASSAQISTTPVSAPTADTKLVGFFGNNGRAATTAPAAMAELTDQASSSTSSATLESADLNLASSGSSGVQTALSATSNSRSIGQLVVLRAAAGAVPPPPPPPPPTPDYTVGVAPGTVSASQGSSATATVSTAVTGGYSGSVTLSASGLPAGTTASFSPATVTAGQTSQLTLAVGSSTTAGNYPVSIAAGDGSRTRTASLTLTVTQTSTVTVGRMLAAPLPLSTGTAFYVATNGSDTNSGTLASPWLTVQKALSTLGPGQIAYVRGGVYAQNLQLTRAGTAASPITIRSYPGESAVLRPALSSPSYPLVLSGSASYVRVQGFVIENAVGSSTTNIYVDGADRIEISDCEIRFSQRQGIFVEPTSTGVQILRNLIHDNGNLANAQQDHGIYIEGTDHLIAGNVIRDQVHGFGIQIYPQALRVTAVSNTIVGNALGGIVVGSDGGTTASDTLIVNNVFVGNQYGVVTYWGGSVGTGNVARSNLAWNNRSGNFSGSGVAYTANTVADPLFVDYAGHNLRLGAGSLALDRAEADYSPGMDLDGHTRPAGAGADLGAFER